MVYEIEAHMITHDISLLHLRQTQNANIKKGEDFGPLLSLCKNINCFKRQI